MELCDSLLTIQECGTALKKLQNNKSPWADGFTTNFYKFFWPDIKDLLYEVTCLAKKMVLNQTTKN